MVSQIPQFGFNSGRYNTSFGTLNAPQQNPPAAQTQTAQTNTQANAQTNAQPNIPQTDTFQNSSDKITNPLQNLTKNQKIGLGAGAVLVLGGLVYVLTRGRAGSNSVKQLAEHIDFKPAQTVEDAIKFGKEQLGIKSYQGFEKADLNMVNWANEGLVNVSNLMKGKAKLPQTVTYKTMKKDTTLAAVSPDKKHLFINKKLFGNLNESINELLESLEKEGLTYQKNGRFSVPLYMTDDNLSLMKPLLSKLQKAADGKKLNFGEKLELYQELNQIMKSSWETYGAPNITLRRLYSTPGVKEILEKAKIPSDLNSVKNLSEQKKCDLIADILAACAEKGKYVGCRFEPLSKFSTIYHEMGHLQDKNLSSHTFAAYHHFKDPEKIKKLEEWVADAEKMEIASSVSSYARADEAEFWADTFARLCDKKKISDEAMVLYKGLGGYIPE